MTSLNFGTLYVFVMDEAEHADLLASRDIYLFLFIYLLIKMGRYMTLLDCHAVVSLDVTCWQCLVCLVSETCWL